MGDNENRKRRGGIMSWWVARHPTRGGRALDSGGKDVSRSGVLASSESLTRGSLLARNSAFNFLGLATPAVVAVLTIPYLVGRLGTDRFGVLTLAWAIVGYMSFLDLGLGRALTKVVAEKLGNREEQVIPNLVVSSLGIMVMFGLAGMALFALVTPWLVHSVLHVPDDLKRETQVAFYVLALTIPIVIVTSGLVGVLQAHQRFGFINIVRGCVGAMTFVGPFVAAVFSANLIPVVIVLACVRVLAFLAYFTRCFALVGRFQGFFPGFRRIAPLLRFGGWITLSNIIGNLMVYWDRFLIGALLPLAALTYYVTPYEIVIRFSILPAAIVSTLFPAFSTTFSRNAPRTAFLLLRACKYAFFLMFPLALLIVVFARESLALWMGPDFAEHSAVVLQWLAIGLFANTLTQIPFAMIQGAGRPDLTVRFHVAQLGPYLLVMWILIRHLGIHGVAIAWTARILIDMVGIFWMATRLLGAEHLRLGRLTAATSAALLVLFTALLVPGFRAGVALSSVVLVLFVPAVWVFGLDASERVAVHQQLARIVSVPVNTSQ